MDENRRFDRIKPSLSDTKSPVFDKDVLGKDEYLGRVKIEHDKLTLDKRVESFSLKDAWEKDKPSAGKKKKMRLEVSGVLVITIDQNVPACIEL